MLFYLAHSFVCIQEKMIIGNSTVMLSEIMKNLAATPNCHLTMHAHVPGIIHTIKTNYISTATFFIT